MSLGTVLTIAAVFAPALRAQDRRLATEPDGTRGFSAFAAWTLRRGQ